jgi:hypothetical protein
MALFYCCANGVNPDVCNIYLSDFLIVDDFVSGFERRLFVQQTLDLLLQGCGI